MLLWITLAALTAATIAFVLHPLLGTVGRAGGGVIADRDADMAVYRDQLAELEADLARGVIAPAEAEMARREVSRRLLRAASGDGANRRSPVTGEPIALQSRRFGMATAALLPLAAIGIYLWLGAPGRPGVPFAAREAAPLDNAPVAELIARVEQRLAVNPSDGRGWDVIAPVYMRLQRYPEAAEAYANATRLLGQSTQRLAGFAEATVLANDGLITEPARRAYERLLELVPDRVEPKFWLLMALEQDGKTDDALAGYRKLLADAPPDAPWRPVVEGRIAELTGKPVADAAAAGPTAEDVKAAAAMTDAERSQMIAGMIEGLAARLKENGNDPAGWSRLVNAYLVLGRHDKATDALADARRALAGNDEGAATLRDLEAALSKANPAPATGDALGKGAVQ